MRAGNKNSRPKTGKAGNGSFIIYLLTDIYQNYLYCTLKYAKCILNLFETAEWVWEYLLSPYVNLQEEKVNGMSLGCTVKRVMREVNKMVFPPAGNLKFPAREFPSWKKYGKREKREREFP